MTKPWMILVLLVVVQLFSLVGLSQVEEVESDSNPEIVAIEKTLNEYILGSTQGQPRRLKGVFHRDLNLYSIRDDRLHIWPGEDYIDGTKPGKATGEDGKVLAIDFENNSAVAKVMISPHNGTRPFIDYFMLLKIEQKWTIVHKMYTRQTNQSGGFGRWSRQSKQDSRNQKDGTRNKSSQDNHKHRSRLYRSAKNDAVFPSFDRLNEWRINLLQALVGKENHFIGFFTNSMLNNNLPSDRIQVTKKSTIQDNAKDEIERIRLADEKLDSIANECLAKQHLPGLAVVVVKDGKTILKRGFGLANVEQKTAVDPDRTMFRIGSVSKALTFLTLARLVDNGRIRREDHVEKYYGAIPNPRNLEIPITIDHLLTHTAGFDQIGVGRHINDFHLSLEQRKSLRPSLSQFLKDDNLRRVTEAGQLFRYDTYGTTLAGSIIEKVVGKSFAVAMKKEMFDCLGMKSTSVEATDEQQANLACGYGWDGKAYVAQPYEIYVTTPASSIDATVADMGRLLEALTGAGANSNGRLFSEEMNEKVLAPQFRAHPEFLGITHGMFESYTSDEANTKIHLRTVGHGGSMRGYRSALTIVPDRKFGVFITANRAPEAGGGNVNFTPILKVIIESLIDGPVRTPIAVPDSSLAADLTSYVGDYYYGTFCHSVTSEDLGKGAWRRGQPRRVVAIDNGLKIGDQVFRAYSKDLFVQNDGNRLVVFNRDAGGNISSFTYSTSPDTFERESKEYPYPEIRSLAQATYERIENDGLTAGIKFFNENTSSNEYYINEDEFNRVGYIFLQSQRDETALQVFQLNAKHFPDSWNVFDSLGEAYSKLKKKELAISNYEKSLRLNPANEEAKKKVQALRNSN